MLGAGMEYQMQNVNGYLTVPNQNTTATITGAIAAGITQYRGIQTRIRRYRNLQASKLTIN